MSHLSEYQAFQKRIEDLYVEHPEVKRIWKRIDRIREITKRGADNDESPNNLFIEGYSGAGKTQCLKKYVRNNPSTTIYDEECNVKIDITPVLYMKLPVPFTYKGFYNNILKSIEPNYPHLNNDVDSIKHQAFSLMMKLQVEVLIIDEMDYLVASTFVQQKAVMENIKDICNSTNVSLVCVGTHEIEPLRTLNRQHRRRYPKTILGHFASCDEVFLDFLQEIEKQLASPIKLNWSDPQSAFAPLLFELTGGLVGYIKPIIREVMELIGVFDEKFNDFSILKNISGTVLLQAQKNVIGNEAEMDMENILGPKG